MNGATINGSKIRVDPFRGDGVKRGDRGDGDIRGSKDGGYSSGDKRGDCGGGEYRGVRGDGFRYGGDRGSRYGKPSYGCGGVYRSRSTMGPSKKQRWLINDGVNCFQALITETNDRFDSKKIIDDNLGTSFTEFKARFDAKTAKKSKKNTPDPNNFSQPNKRCTAKLQDHTIKTTPNQTDSKIQELNPDDSYPINEASITTITVTLPPIMVKLPGNLKDQLDAVDIEFMSLVKIKMSGSFLKYFPSDEEQHLLRFPTNESDGKWNLLDTTDIEIETVLIGSDFFPKKVVQLKSKSKNPVLVR
ncbi:hypothetical protein CEXT_557361 [Caerostris extrusa]|uniref:Uncharacterized protein n=1 Tax=Caerostris extrusa TaxID=172846 RepID=A0AAV4VQN0_CAEEX|nr:hypothetical protein CEXT_557361 [Caerostris extrusa]